MAIPVNWLKNEHWYWPIHFVRRPAPWVSRNFITHLVPLTLRPHLQTLILTFLAFLPPSLIFIFHINIHNWDLLLNIFQNLNCKKETREKRRGKRKEQEEREREHQEAERKESRRQIDTHIIPPSHWVWLVSHRWRRFCNYHQKEVGNNLQFYPTVVKYQSSLLDSVQGTVDLWSYILPIDRYSHTL